MPRVRPLTSGDRQNTQLVATIYKYMALNGVKTIGELGPLMGISPTTARKRINHPEEFQAGELRNLIWKLHIPWDELQPGFMRGKE